MCVCVSQPLPWETRKRDGALISNWLLQITRKRVQAAQIPHYCVSTILCFTVMFGEGIRMAWKSQVGKVRWGRRVISLPPSQERAHAQVYGALSQLHPTLPQLIVAIWTGLGIAHPRE